MFEYLPAVTARLKTIIAGIVVDRRSTGAPLTWALLHMIEQQALAELRNSNLDPSCINMIRPSLERIYPQTDQPVDFSGAALVPVAFAMIEQEFSAAH
jgi:hypothetical protein